MSDSSPPPKPKPGSLRDRIAAFEQKPASAPGPPAPRPKPGNLSQWKPRPASPHDNQPVINRADASMSASDAKVSITGSLKERMAALQGLGAFGGGPTAAPPPKPAEKPKWKPPPQVAVAPPVTGDDDEDDSSAADNKSPTSPLRAPSDDMSAALSKAQPQPAHAPVQEEPSEIATEAPVEGEDAADPEEEARQRRAAIAARMARLGGTRVGMGPPIFGRKPETKPKPAEQAPETPKEEPSTDDVRVAELLPNPEAGIEQAQVDTGVAENVPLPTSPPTDETAALSPEPQVTPSENFPQQPPASESPHIPPRSMPVPQGPRRAAPPRKKSSQKQTPPAVTEPATSSLEKDTSIHDVSETVSGSQTTPVSVPDPVEPEFDAAADPNATVRPAETADENPQPIALSSSVTAVPDPEVGTARALPPIPPPPPLGPHTESPDDVEVDARPEQDILSPEDTGESIAPSIPAVSRITQEETEVEPVVVPELDEDETPVAQAEEEDEDETARRQRVAERVAKMGGFNPFGGQPMRSPTLEDEPSDVERKESSGAIPIESEGMTLQSQPAATAEPPIPYSVFQLGGSATVNEEGDGDDDGNDESDLHAQVPLQHGLGEPSMGKLEGDLDCDDAHTRVAHEVEVKTFTQTAHGAMRNVSDAAAPSPPSTVQRQYATDDDFGAAQAHAEGEPLAPELSAADDNDTSDNEMPPPRVTRPLPPAPVPPVPDVSPDLSAALAQIPPPPAVPKRTSLPPPTRAVPVPSPDSPPPAQGSSPQRAPPAKRYSLLPPSREIPIPAPDSPDAPLQRRQTLTKRMSLSPPSRVVPSPSVSREGSLIAPPPPPPQPSFSHFEQEQIKEAPQVRDELISPPPPVPTPTRKPSVAPPVPDGRRSMESRRSTDSRRSHEERRGSGQYAVVSTVAVPGPASPPSKKRVPAPLPLEQEVFDDNVGDPIDPRFHAPSRSPNATAISRSPPPISGTDPLSSASPATPPPVPPAPSESEGHEDLKRRKTIADRMAKLGGIRFGAPPPPVNRVQPSILAQPAEDAGTEGNTAGPGHSAPEGEEEEDEQARRQRIAAKLAGMGGMRFGMLPVQPGMGVVSPPPPPPIPTRLEEEATPRSPPRTIPPPRQPTARYPESDQEYEHPSSSDDGVQVEAEESEIEEVRHEDLEDEYGVEDVEEDQFGSPPPPPPPRSTRPPVPSTRPPPIPPIGRRPSLEVRSGSFDTITPAPRPPARQVTSDFVMVEAEEALLAPPAQSSRGPQPLPSGPPSLEPSDLAGTGYWELPSIPSGSLEFHDSGVASDLSGSRWSEDSTTYLPAAPPPPHLPASVPPRAPAAAVTARMTADELRAVWYRVGAHVAEAAAGLFERSKRTLVGTGSYEGFIAEALAQVPNASPPHEPGEYGFLIYAQTGAQVHTRLTDIMPGDVAVIEGARLKGHKGLHTYSMSVGEASPCMGIVSDFDAKKLKLKALQANQRVGQATVESVSYRLEDLKSGTIKVYRVQEA